MILLNIYVIFSTKKFIYSKDSLPSRDMELAVVPGAGLKKDKTPSLVLADRLDGSIRLYKENLVGKILISGDHQGEKYSETEAMKRYLLENGIPECDIIRDNQGFSTFETVLNCKKSQNPAKAYFVSQAFHLPRLIFTARRFGIDALGYECNYHNYTPKKHRKWKAREFPSRIKDFFLSTYYILSKKI